jgi:uncharacterized SAM-binding protein YcdF (DUF218 family)
VCLQGDTTLRLEATLALYRAGRISAIIVSGGVAEQIEIDELPASSMREWLVSRGVPVDKIYVEPEAKTTFEHANLVYALACQYAASDLLLITSGYHLPRAYLRFLFEKRVVGSNARLFGHAAGGVLAWLTKTPTGKRRRIALFLTSELNKIRTYAGLVSLDEARAYVAHLSTSESIDLAR